VGEGLAGRRDPGGGEPLAELGPGERSLLADCARDQRDRPLGLVGRHALLAQAPAAHRGLAGGAQRVQPRVVVAVDEVQRAAEQPARDDLARVARRVDPGRGQAGRAGPERERGRALVLGLDGEEVTDDAGGPAGRRAVQALSRGAARAEEGGREAAGYAAAARLRWAARSRYCSCSTTRLSCCTLLRRWPRTVRAATRSATAPKIPPPATP
jgi:hypothetical protein